MTEVQGAVLTPRTVEVITGYARGLTAGQIAAELGIGEKTVAHRTQRTAKVLGVRGARQAALVDYAYRNGYLIVELSRPGQPLPPRLEQVLDCAARGLGARATAAELGIATKTARRHLERLHQALGVHTTARAVAIAWEAGLRSRPAAPTPREGTT